MNNWKEKIEDRLVTYTLQFHDKFIVIENVPARVNIETGEQLFSPETVEKIQKTVWENKSPLRILETPVYKFAS